ncbi:N-acyl amino acid synthase FeeM domain-containing protein [Bowmanella pacifica]|uniref:N-acyl amino acid synthase FeeM domain-containing protein n=1 Tax=Bowmanella pacifica TaxID=502051 RepID=UPI001667A65F|nr:GNAT family N-acyltransferase [Bowmanella pacifica]
MAKEEHDISESYRLRYRVYVEEEGYFRENEDREIKDGFDERKDTRIFNAIYKGTVIGTLRTNIDNNSILPPELIYDYSKFRKQAALRYAAPVKFGSAGMLAISRKWRYQRHALTSLLKSSCLYGLNNDVTHILVTINKRSITLYKKLGYNVIEDEIWVEDVGEYVFPATVELYKLYSKLTIR